VTADRPGQTAGAERAGEPRERGAEAGRSFEELLGADAYGAYVEVRRVASLFDSAEIKAALGGAALLDPAMSDLLQLANFIGENSEALAEARVAVALMPTRADLPQPLLAVELPSDATARLFEPKLRTFLNDRGTALGVLAEAPARPARVRGGGRTRARAPRPSATSTLNVRRAGNWLLAADRPFIVRRLGGEAGSLADSARFQNLRSRFANESVFVYVDTDRSQRSWIVQAQRAQEEAETARRAAGPDSDEDRERYDPDLAGAGETAMDANEAAAVEVVPPARVLAPPGTTSTTTPTIDTVIVTAPEEPTAPTSDAGGPVGEGEAGEAAGLTAEPTPIEGSGPPAPPTAEQNAGRHFGLLLSGLFNGVPRLPGAVAAGLGVEGETISLRVAVENAPDGPAGLIPFLPSLAAGPAVAVESSAAAPAANGILFATTLDWVRIFDALMSAGETGGQMAGGETTEPSAEAAEVAEAAEPAAAETDEPVTAEARLAFVEKVLGFRFRQDLLPALGNEVAVSLPIDIFTGLGRMGSMSASFEIEEEEKEAEPGFVVLVALNDPERVRPLVPKLALMLGMAGGTPGAEKREGYEINTLGSFAYSFVGRFLLLSYKVSHLRHAVDSYARGETLAQTDAYRDSTAWQAPQRLAHGYVSPELMASVVRETKRMGESSDDPIVIATLPQLDLAPEPVSFAATDEGDLLIHELRLPLNLGRIYAAAAVITAREGSNVGAEAMAAYALNSIYHAEMSYRGRKDRERYATLEELIAEGLVDKGFVQSDAYKIELTAVGDRFEVAATPRTYGKTGRRSFYLDQSGVLRGADHKGRPATADDPPID
jgi:hypothetical protein